jgi:hypothetical protein
VQKGGFDISSWGFGLGKGRSAFTFVTESQTHKSNRIMFKLFIQGGAGFMTILTVLLVAIFFAAWKAPRWIKEIGTFALVFGFLTYLIGLYQMFQAFQQVASDLGEGVSGLFDLISPDVFFGGMRIGLIPVFYGVIIYLISLIVRIVKKPRL